MGITNIVGRSWKVRIDKGNSRVDTTYLLAEVDARTRFPGVVG